jgi:hypothetical protein
VASETRLRYVRFTGGPRIIVCWSNRITTDCKGFERLLNNSRRLQYKSNTVHVTVSTTINRLGVLVLPNHYTLYIFVVSCKVDLRTLKKECKQRRRNKYHVQMFGRKNRAVVRESLKLLLC